MGLMADDVVLVEKTSVEDGTGFAEVRRGPSLGSRVRETKGQTKEEREEGTFVLFLGRSRE